MLHGLFQSFEISYNNLGWKGLLRAVSSNLPPLKDDVGSKHRVPGISNHLVRFENPPAYVLAKSI